MTGPANINPRGLVRPLDTMLTAGGEGWDALQKLFEPAVMSDRWRPDDQILKFVAAMSQTEQGRAFLDWIFDLTNRAPYPSIGGGIEQAALAAAKHEARAAVGEVILTAIVEGRRLLAR
jgi:hypothetical protein